jgi:PhnB protein
VHGVAKLIDFMRQAFDAEVVDRMDLPDGTVGHAQVRIGDSRVMMGVASDKWPARPGGFYMYVADCDDTYRRALAAGGTSLREPTNEFYGDRSCGVEDASGVQWWISTHVEDVTPEEMERRSKEFARERAQGETA